jgi:two-component system chemotaxis response regulator CheY
MLIQLIEQHAERAFLKTLVEFGHKAGARGVLMCRTSMATPRLGPREILPAVKDILSDHEGELYFLGNGDIAIVWHGQLTAILEALVASLRQHFPNLMLSSDIVCFYDMQAHAEDLRLQFMERLKQLTPPTPANTNLASEVRTKPVFTDAQLHAFAGALPRRSLRQAPEILIVEDQEFSRKLLVSMLERQYICHAAANAAQAIDIYAQHAPDMVFQDVELPDINGHALAGLYKKYDPQRFIVMVTANHYLKDVETAKSNNVQGFIAKPYSKQKIQGAIDMYLKTRKPRGQYA